MMNYSVILLGATISVSLYIRLCVVCGAIEVNSGLDNNQKYSQHLSRWEAIQLENGIDPDPFANYREHYLRILRDKVSGIGKFNSVGLQAEDIDEFVEQRITYLKNAPAHTKHPRIVEKHSFEDDYYDEQICGIMHRPYSPGRSEENDEEQKMRVITDGSAPKGCFYEDTLKRNLACNERNMRQVPRLPVELSRLHVSGTKIQEVNRTNFGDVSIKNIQLVQNQISEMQPWAFSNVRNIGTLEIMDNFLSYLAFDIYFGLTDVFALHLDGNQISFEIYENCTARDNISEIPLVLPKLIMLSLRRNPLKIIPAQMWAGLRESELTYLDLTQCILEFIHEDSFTFLPKLRNLYLESNPRLMPNLVTAFKGLRNGSLEILSLGNNGLHRFPTEALSYVSDTLLSLDMSGNPIAYLEKADLPPNLTQLRVLNLARCMLMEIQSGTLDLLPNLKTLDLQRNFLTRLPTMTALSKLEFLNLNDNVMIPDPIDVDNGDSDRKFVIPDFGFANLTNLRSLYFINTKVKIISKYSLTGLSKLERLFFEKSELEIIVDEAFTDLESLLTLSVENNKNPINLNSLTFYGLSNLTHLRLVNCGINFPKFPRDPEDNNATTTATTEMDDHIQDQELKLFPDYFRPFMFLTSLEILEVSNNTITELYPELFHTNTKLIQLLFDGNKIKSWNTPLLQNNYTMRRDAGSDKPDASDNTMFYLSTNLLSFITDAMIADIFSFQPFEMDLSRNAFMCDKGACALRDLMTQPNETDIISGNWTSPSIKFLNMKSYTCVDPRSDFPIKIINVTNEMCQSFDRSADTSTSQNPIFEDSNWTTIIIASTVSVTGIIIIAIVGYKQRAQIRYLIFRAQLNISLPRTAKTSLSELIQYDFDIFVSYHNDDRNFILEKFLPEVEDPGFRSDDMSHQDIAMDLELSGPKKSATGFRVCLHERDFEAGMPITENILDSVDRSKKIVIVISKKYLESQWCTFEMNLAYHRLVENRRNSFVVIILEEIPSNLRTKVLNYLMRSTTYLEWPGDNASQLDVGRFWTRLRSSFKATE